MESKIVVKDGLGVVCVKGRLDAETAQGFRMDFAGWMKELDFFVLNLQETVFIDSSGLGIIILILKKLLDKKGNIVITGMSDRIRMVFEITRAQKLFDIYDTPEAAEAALKLDISKNR